MGHSGIGHIARVSEKNHQQHTELRGGLPGRSLRRLDEYVHDNLAHPISLAELSSIAGLSKRHFLRAFQESVGFNALSLRAFSADQRGEAPTFGN